MASSKAPKMNRSRGQLATVYAPHSLFTFEGGTGSCIALPTPNRAYEASSASTRSMIHEQIVEFMESWLRRAMGGRNTVVPVVPERALDGGALQNGSVHLPIGSLHFQVPERVGYVPFPATFVCTRCGLYRSCNDEVTLAKRASQFRIACPSSPAQCADDWQQLDVVMTHWSGAVDPLSPMRRHVGNDERVVSITRCSTCGGERYYLRRDSTTFARWRFECVDCGTPREIKLQDKSTLEILAHAVLAGQNVLPQINMEAISCRASAVYYSQGDRLLVFGNDKWISLLKNTNTRILSRFLADQFGFPPPELGDDDKERLLRDAGRGNEWQACVELRQLIETAETNGMVAAAEMIRVDLKGKEAEWNETVFASRVGTLGSLQDAVDARLNFVRRFDPIRMAVEHRTLQEEYLRSGATLPNGKLLSVDVTRPDDFLVPDSASDSATRESMIQEVGRRLAVLGVQEMRLIRGLHVCEYTFGYTRTSPNPLVMREKAGQAEMPVRLNLFRRIRIGDLALFPVLCLEQTNEAFYVKLDEDCVLAWLQENGAAPEAVLEPRLGGRLIEEYPAKAFSRFLDEYRGERSVKRSAYPFVYTLLHSVAHHFIGQAASMSGLDPGSFGEHLFVPNLAFVIYRRGMTMDLGNLSSMWRDRGDPVVGNELLDRLASSEGLRCGSESVCTHHGGACPDCILIPETACLTRNELLSRSVLVGRGTPRWDSVNEPLKGFYEVARSINPAKRSVR